MTKTKAGWVLIVAALVFLGWSGWSLWQAQPGSTDDFGRDRDLALRSGRAHVAALNSMDVSRIDAGLRTWQDASTGPLHDQLQRESAQSKQKILQSGTTAVATVDDAAVTALDLRSGSAQLIATVRIELTRRQGQPTVQRKRYEAGLTRTPSGWKLKSLTVIPVSAR